MRPIPGSFNDNSRRCLLTRRGLLCGIAAATVTAKLPAQERPRRIVSTAPSITEALFAPGFGDQVVGVSRFCNFPPSVQKLPKVGTCLSPDAEAIARLAPDLVVLQRISGELTGRLNALHIRFIEVPHGTLSVELTRDCLLGERGMVVRGHSFHYSRIADEPSMPTSYSVSYSLSGKREDEGFSVGNVLASYVHLHFGAAPDLARHFVEFARSCKGKELTSA